SGVCCGGRRRRGSGGSGDGDGGDGSRVTRWWWRVGESGVGDRVDRSKRSLFGFAGKSPPKNFFGGGGVVAGGGGRLAGGGGVGEKIGEIGIYMVIKDLDLEPKINTHDEGLFKVPTARRWNLEIILACGYVEKSSCKQQLRPLGRHLEEIHVTWAQYWKKPDMIANWHNEGLKNCSQKVETASGFLATPSRITSDGVKTLGKTSEYENPIRTLEDYSKSSHKGYRNTYELPVGNNVVPLRSDTIRLVQNGCSFHGLRSEDPNQHLKDFLKLVDSLDLDVANRERTHLRLFQFSLYDQTSNWLKRLPAGSISTWEDLTTRGKLRDRNAKESWALLEDLARYDKESWNDPRDFAKPVKAISLPQDVPSTSDLRLIELEN
nr:MAK10-like protein [Tanacetum cinerariifolium]GEZ38416.1 MAK10-like protein [Tanacetum cinerariifolium]